MIWAFDRASSLGLAFPRPHSFLQLLGSKRHVCMPMNASLLLISVSHLLPRGHSDNMARNERGVYIRPDGTKTFVPLENNPAVFTELVHRLGVSSDLAFYECGPVQP